MGAYKVLSSIVGERQSRREIVKETSPFAPPTSSTGQICGTCLAPVFTRAHQPNAWDYLPRVFHTRAHRAPMRRTASPPSSSRAHLRPPGVDSPSPAIYTIFAVASAGCAGSLVVTSVSLSRGLEDELSQYSRQAHPPCFSVHTCPLATLGGKETGA